ncbi:MAG TPA: ComEA family DNA-binding protein [Solirubrobacterales bacterium]|nr:ComEA family DNA-binding protein [Solirubrobacterales bacterium]
MPELSRAQIAVYGAIAVALLLVGARAIRGEGGEAESSFAAGAAPGAAESGSEGEAGGFTISGQAGDLVVDVTGAVARPGVYRMPAGSRVNDAVLRAGGATGRAELEAVNLAARLADGQQVVVPERAPGGGVAAASGTGDEAGPISLGTATVEELDTIDGIGPVTAEDIVQFREEHGGLASVDQLDQISGIGPATMESLRARLQP